MAQIRISFLLSIITMKMCRTDRQEYDFLSICGLKCGVELKSGQFLREFPGNPEQSLTRWDPSPEINKEIPTKSGTKLHKMQPIPPNLWEIPTKSGTQPHKSRHICLVVVWSLTSPTTGWQGQANGRTSTHNSGAVRGQVTGRTSVKQMKALERTAPHTTRFCMKARTIFRDLQDVLVQLFTPLQR